MADKKEIHKDEEAKKSLFGPKKSEAPSERAVNNINSLNRTVRLLEDKIGTLRNKVQMLDNNVLSTNKKIVTEQKVLQNDLMDLKLELNDIKEKMRLIVHEIKLGAKIEDVKVLQKYLELWEPINFVTRKEVENIVEDAIDKRWHKIE